jgi:hypothetical protein
VSTRFCGHKTGFNPTGDNDMVPNEFGPPDTKFGGRPAVPAGPLKRYPGAAADISTGNRRLAKATHGHGEGDGSGGVTYSGHPSGFRLGVGTATGNSSKAFDTKGGKGSGFRKGGKKP